MLFPSSSHFQQSHSAPPFNKWKPLSQRDGHRRKGTQFSLSQPDQCAGRKCVCPFRSRIGPPKLWRWRPSPGQEEKNAERKNWFYFIYVRQPRDTLKPRWDAVSKEVDCIWVHFVLGLCSSIPNKIVPEIWLENGDKRQRPRGWWCKALNPIGPFSLPSLLSVKDQSLCEHSFFAQLVLSSNKGGNSEKISSFD
ncbi:hypothetical protein Ddc_01860 [Ditylenchus destructor]|nr:hypothetical protein Ddc_01860 [Ditylenchus destructor]